MPKGPPLPFIPSEDSNVMVNSPMSLACPVSSSDLTPTELELPSSLERNRMYGFSTESLALHFLMYPDPWELTLTLSPVHEQSTDMMSDSRGIVRYAPPTTSLVAFQEPQLYQQGFDATGRRILYRDFIPVSTAVAPDMFQEMHSTSNILCEFRFYSVVFLYSWKVFDVAREGIKCIDKGLDGNFYVFPRSFPWGVDITILWRQLYGSMVRVFLVLSQEMAWIEMPTNGEFNIYQYLRCWCSSWL